MPFGVSCQTAFLRGKLGIGLASAGSTKRGFGEAVADGEEVEVVEVGWRLLLGWNGIGVGGWGSGVGGVIRLTLRSLAALPAGSLTSAVRYWRTAVHRRRAIFFALELKRVDWVRGDTRGYGRCGVASQVLWIDDLRPICASCQHDRSRMHLLVATYFQMKRHLMRSPVAEGAQILSCWEVVGGFNLLKVAATPKPSMSSRKRKKCCSPRPSVSASRKLVNSLYIGERNCPRSLKKELYQVEEGYFLRPSPPLIAVSMLKAVNMLLCFLSHRLEFVVG